MNQGTEKEDELDDNYVRPDEDDNYPALVPWYLKLLLLVQLLFIPDDTRLGNWLNKRFWC